MSCGYNKGKKECSNCVCKDCHMTTKCITFENLVRNYCDSGRYEALLNCKYNSEKEIESE